MDIFDYFDVLVNLMSLMSLRHFSNQLPMFNPPCESVQICTDPNRYPRIW